MLYEVITDASRARAEAEEATRRLTRQNWENYTQQEEAATGFVYDSVKVSPLGNETVITSYSIHYTKLYDSGISPKSG